MKGKMKQKGQKPTVREMSISFFCFKNHLYTFKNYLRGWKSLYVKTIQVEQVPFLWWQFTILTPGPHTNSKQSKTFHAKRNLKVNCEKNWVW